MARTWKKLLPLRNQKSLSKEIPNHNETNLLYDQP